MLKAIEERPETSTAGRCSSPHGCRGQKWSKVVKRDACLLEWRLRSLGSSSQDNFQAYYRAYYYDNGQCEIRRAEDPAMIDVSEMFLQNMHSLSAAIFFTVAVSFCEDYSHIESLFLTSARG